MGFGTGANWKGNRRGRPKRGESLADLIRHEGGKEGEAKMVRRMWTLAGDPHDRPDLAIKAAEWIARHGYESHSLQLETSGAVKLTVTHEIHPPAEDDA